MEEARWLKCRQYTTAYYALLLYAAIIALFQIKTVIKPVWVYGMLKYLAMGFVVVIAVISHIYQNDHYYSILHYRRGFDTYYEPIPEEEKRRWTYKITSFVLNRISKKENNIFNQQNLRTKWFYTTTFKLLTWLGAIAAEIAIYFDT